MGRVQSPFAGRAFAVALAAFVLVLSAGACSLMITDNPPPYTCWPDASDPTYLPLCPGNMVCAPTGQCVESCVGRACQVGSCDHATGACLTLSDAGIDERTPEDVTVAHGDADVAVSADATTDANRADSDAVVEDASSDGRGGCPGGFGCRCNGPVDCDIGFACVDRVAIPDIWSLAIDAGSGDGGPGDGSVCMEPCCTSSDCDYAADAGWIEGHVCYATGAGGNYCVPPAWLGDRSTLTLNKPGGSSCGGDAGGCRSGLCNDAGFCADTCCDTKSSNECATSGDYCRFGVFPGGTAIDMHQAANCTVPASTGTIIGGQGCGMNSDCKSNLCLDSGMGMGMGGGPRCADACRNRDNCQPGSPMRSQTCTYIQPFAGSSDIVAACIQIPNQAGGGDGGGSDGMPCRVTSDCARGYCAMQPGAQQGVCLAVCFFDSNMTSSSDCPMTERCRPQPVAVGSTTYSVLACGN